LREYQYIGSVDFIPTGEFPPRTQVDGADTVAKWMAAHRDQVDIEECIPATFIVDTDGSFWIADRGSEHVACARLGSVLSAGEVFFTLLGSTPSIYRITNQSTGYCPEPDSWKSVEVALSKTGIEFPYGFEPPFEFRRCTGCGTLAIVKEEVFTCLMCGTDLPHHWNIQSENKTIHPTAGNAPV
jgi:hypothetical protein